MERIRRDLYTVRGPDGPEVVRCRDCKHSSEVYSVDLTEMEPCPDGKLDCGHFSVWDHYDDIPGHCFVDSYGFCAWGERA